MKNRTPNRYLVRLLLAQICAFSAATPVFSQQVKPEAAPVSQPAGGAPAVTPETMPSEDETIVLSPFTVQSSRKDIGYYASNTLAGSRLNSNVGDLAAPITVITKQQLEDTGARDLNDVFLYEANTEGAGNYTPIEVNRSGLKDRIGGSATNGIGANTSVTANRVRGLGNADMMWNYYRSISRVRGDTYNASSLELSRGPNAILAGMGSPAGILNQSINMGRIGVDSNEVNFAVGSFDSYRASVSVNRTLVQDKLAINFAALYDNREFSRKPSYDVSKRQSGGFTYKPFKKTTIKGFVENYNNYSRTPNQLTPRDGVTPWLRAGRPVWNPLTQQVTYLDTGAVSAPYRTNDTQVIVYNGANVTLTGDAVLTDPRSPRYVAGLGFPSYARPTQFINPDGSNFWMQGRAGAFNIYGFTQAQINADPTRFNAFNARIAQSSVFAAPIGIYDIVGGGNFVPSSVTDQRIYDWNEVNIAATNYGEMRNATYNLEFEQQLLPNLFFSAGWFKQDLDTLEQYPISQLATTTLMVDVNQFLPDGRANPNYLRPFVDAQDPDTAKTPETNETYRAMLAYDLDFTKNDGWSKWLGRHRLLGYVSRQEGNVTTQRFRRAFSDPSDPRYVVPLTAMGLQTARAAGYRFAGNASGSRQVYYVGDGSSVVGYGPSAVARNPLPGEYISDQITSYNWATNTWDQANVTYGTEWFDAGGGVSSSQTIVNSMSFAAQSFWWNDRIVTTYGVREDKWSGRNTTTAAVPEFGLPALNDAALYPNWRLAEHELGLLDRWGKREYLKGNTGTLGAVVKPTRWFSVFANTSDNFNPPPNASTDIFGRALPKPTGESTDYGVSLNLFDNKLVARVTLFETTNEAERAPTANTLLGRLTRMDSANLRAWADMVIRVRGGADPTASNDWANNTINPMTPTQQAAAQQLMGGLPYNWPTGTSFSSTQTNKAEGMEFEVIYNPKPNWNIKFTAAKQETSYENIIPEYDAWYASRLPIWQAAAAPDMAAEYIQPNGTRVSLRNFYTGYGFGETNVVTGVNGFNPQDWYAKVVAGEVAAARQLEGASPYGQRKWRANILSNYLFTNGILKDFSVGGAVRWEDRAVIGYYGVTNASGQYLRTDISRPIYDTNVGADRWKDLTHFDLWLSYRFKMLGDRVRTKVQLNVVDVLQSGDIMPVYAGYDGNPVGYRILDSRRITLSTKMEF
ncbi:TonB-dependent receptor plug domain-containing protein [Nibricoccus aquaticus]|uniref:TonB-dependent receptor plug domain-containing protein n=1 Tax=Nibricoccus aquaticus TaxID=2576891 RepID=UPI0010FE56DB|nr:TonB-dependent receptor plug domain-containing protein [Nibricoccus aquaticus]